MWVAADDREFAVRLARYCARNPVALSRLEYRSDDATLTYHSDKPTGPTAGSETVDVLEFLARVVSHIPNKGQVLQRYYGWYANRTRGIRRRAGQRGVNGGSTPSLVASCSRGRLACLSGSRCWPTVGSVAIGGGMGRL